MIRWQIELMWPLLLTLLALAAFALYVYTHSGRLYRLKLVLIPALMAATAFSFPWLASRMGYACPEALPERFEYLAHKLILEHQRKAWIDVLVVSRKPLEHDARLHRVPWSQPLEDALKQAQKLRRQEGGEVQMERDRRADDYPQWMPRRVRPQDSMPKDPLPEPPVVPGNDLLSPRGPSI